MNIINEQIINEYLTCGQTYDNYLFCNCPSFVLDFAQQNLSYKTNNITPINITITRDIEIDIEKTINQSDNVMHRQLLYRDYIISVIIREIYKHFEDKNEEINKLSSIITAFFSEDLKKIKDNHAQSPMPFEISLLSKKLGKIELNLFLVNTQNKELQQAINNLIYSREPYSIKLFTNNTNLPSYSTQNGEFIECPHDYTSININEFLTTIIPDEM